MSAPLTTLVLLSGSEPDWTALGIVLCVVGSFLLGNAILFRPPRSLVEELFGKPQVRLRAIREYVFHRAQVGVGFTFLLAGFALQLLGRYRPGPAASAPEFPAVWIGSILVLTLVLLALGWISASRSFRRHVRAHLVRHPPDFEADLALAREVGELFGVESREDDTVQSYLERLHRALELPPPVRGRKRESPLPRPDEIDLE